MGADGVRTYRSIRSGPASNPPDPSEGKDLARTTAVESRVRGSSYLGLAAEGMELSKVYRMTLPVSAVRMVMRKVSRNSREDGSMMGAGSFRIWEVLT